MRAAHLLAGLLGAGLIALSAPSAQAYPQFQLVHGQTCSSCHYSPAGGGLLSEMGRDTSTDVSSDEDSDGTFMYGKVPLPSWLEIGGDLRAAGGVIARGAVDPKGAVFPMQADLYLRAAYRSVSVNATVGFQPWREHYVMWKPEEGSEGYYARVGRFMPVFGLRLAEHPSYNRRFGQTPLYGETYGVGVGKLSGGAELHVSAFVRDPVFDSIERGNGVALYGEKRLLEGKAAVGLEARYARSVDEDRLTGGVTSKYWLDGPGVLLQGELQVNRQDFDAGPVRHQLVGYLLGSWFFKQGFWLDLGVGHYDEDLDVKDIDRDAVDTSVHWQPLSHLELLITTRLQMIGLGSGGDSSGYALFMAHYRL